MYRSIIAHLRLQRNNNNEKAARISLPHLVAMKRKLRSGHDRGCLVQIHCQGHCCVSTGAAVGGDSADRAHEGSAFARAACATKSGVLDAGRGRRAPGRAHAWVHALQL